MNIHNKKIYILILLTSVVFAQTPVTSIEWTENSCNGLEAFNFDDEWCGIQDNSNYYLLDNNQSLYKFTVDKQNLSLENFKHVLSSVVPKWQPMIHEEIIYFRYLSGWNDGSHGLAVYPFDAWQNGGHEHYHSDPKQDFQEVPFFYINNAYYFLSFDGHLYECTLGTQVTDPTYTYTSEAIAYAPKEKTSMLILDNTVYYFSKNGFCSITISNGTLASESKINCVDVTDETSSLATDNNSKIWIINFKDGVVEYNIKENTAKTIATFPASKMSNKAGSTQFCFYSDNFLHLINNKKVYLLDIKYSPDELDEPDEPDDHDQSGHTCGCLGFEFLLILAGLFILRRRH